MINAEPRLCHHFFQVPVAERISQIPEHTEQDDFFFEVVSFDQAGN